MMMAFPLDSDSRGPRFYNVSAHVDAATGQIHLSGAYDAADLVPVLLFSVGTPWVEPCLRHVCCLWDVLERHRDHALMDALGSPCDERVNLTSKDLMKGNHRGGKKWAVDTMIHPSFVAMLFLCLSPVFYMYYEIVPLEWEAGSAHWSSSWYGQPCHQVTYTDGRKLCIYCANEKPVNAQFIFTPNWFQTFQCKWECLPGFMGPGCEVSAGLAVSIGAGVIGVLCVSCVIGVIVSLWGGGGKNNARMWASGDGAGGNNNHSRDAEKPIPPLSTQMAAHYHQELSIKPPSYTPRAINHDVISFKEDGPQEIRIKLL